MDSAIQAQTTDTPTDDTTDLTKRVDIPKALTLRVQNNLTYREIASVLGVKKSSVHAALKKYGDLINSPDQVSAFERNRSKLLSGAEMMLLTDMADKDKRQKASLNNVAFAWDKIQLAKRLEDNKSTENIELIQQVIADNKDILDNTADAMLERMREQSQVDDGPDEATEGEFEEAD